MRSITWLYLLDATFDSPVLTRERRADWLRALFQHGRFIDFLPETSARVAGDHFVAGQTGRFALGVVFAGCAEGQRWREEALAALAADSPDQIDDDGVYRGGAIAYGALIAELHRVVLELARRNSIDVPDHFATRADKLAAFILTCTPASGLIPAIGDCDDARVLPLDPTAARRDRGFLGGGDASAEAALWQSPTIAPAIVRDRGAAFRDTGFYVLRTATLTAVVDGFRTFARAPNGQRHESRLAVVVADASGELVCDPGVAGYTADREVEQRFRSAQAHNVLAPRGAAQTIGSRPGRIGHEGHVELCHYSADAAREEVELAFDGYPGLVWWRRVVLDRRRAVVLVEDRIDPTTEQMLEIRWHLPPGEAAVAGGVASIAGRGAVVALDVASEQGCWRVEPGEIALRYGSREPAPVLVREVSASAAARWLTAIVSLRDRTLGDAVTAAREAAA